MSTLVYDRASGACVRYATWLADRLPAPHGVRGEASTDDVRWVDDGGVTVEGHAAIGRSLMATGTAWIALGWLMASRPTSWVASPLYRALTSKRGRIGLPRTMPPASVTGRGPEDPPGKPFVRGVLEVALILAIFTILRQGILARLVLPPAAYGRPILLVEALKHRGILAVFGLPALLVFVRPTRSSWPAIGDRNAARMLIGGVCLVLAWAFSTYDYDVFVGQAHLVDRVLLVCVAGVVLLTPKAVTAFLPYVLLVVAEFDGPGIGRADKSLLFKVLILFIAFLIVRLVVDVRDTTFFFTTGALIAANLGNSGIKKLRIGWLHNDLSHLWMAAHLNGFIGHLSLRNALRVGATIHRLNLLLLVGTLVIEVGFIALWWFRRSPMVLLPGAVLLHLAIFASSGIFFWKWVVLESLLLIAVTMVGWRRIVDAVGGRLAAIAMSAAMVVLASHYAMPVQLAWFDSTVTYNFEVYAVTPKGRVHIARHFFAPHDIEFSQDRFDFLSKRPTLAGTFATVHDLRRLETLDRVRTCAQLDRLEDRIGHPVHRPRLVKRFVRMVRLYVRDSKTPEARGLGWRVLEWVQAPVHIWLQTPPPTFRTGEKATAVIVTRERFIYRDGKLRTCRPERLGRINL